MQNNFLILDTETNDLERSRKNMKFFQVFYYSFQRIELNLINSICAKVNLYFNHDN